MVKPKNTCWIAGTRIAQPGSREINIEEIKPGDIVLGFDLKENRYLETKVLSIFSEEVNSVIKIETNDSISYVTPDHIFYGVHRDIIRAANISRGTLLLCKDGHFQNVIFAERIQEKVTVYNFETDCHTYIANDFISHNCDLSEE